MEEFDGLQNWVRYEGRVGNQDNIDRMPKTKFSALKYTTMDGTDTLHDNSNNNI